MAVSNSSIIPFQFESHPIRTVILDDQPWFVAKDVAETLGYENPDQAVHVNCRGAKSLKELLSLLNRDSMKINELRSTTLLIPEADVYRLTMRSKLESAERFQDWVCEEVLPSIRKTGGYSTQPHNTEVLAAIRLGKEAARMARAFGFKGNMIALSADNLVQQRVGFSLLELMGATHLLADARGMTYTPTQLGELMEPPQSARAVNKLLEAAGLQKSELGSWLPTDEATKLVEWLDTGKRHSNGTPIKQLKWFKEVLTRLEVAA